MRKSLRQIFGFGIAFLGIISLVIAGFYMLTADLLGFPITLMPLVALFIGLGITLIGLYVVFQ